MLCSTSGAFRRRERPHTRTKPAALLVYDPESLPEVTHKQKWHKLLIAIPARWIYFHARSADLATVTNRGIVSHSFIPPSVFEQGFGKISQHLPEVRVQGLRGRAAAVKRLHQHNKSELLLKSMTPKKASVFYTNTTMVGLNHSSLLIVMISTLSLHVTDSFQHFSPL